MPQKNNNDWNTGEGSVWDNIKRGALQGVKEFVRDPVTPTVQAHKDFTRADDLTGYSNRASSSSGSGGSSENKGLQFKLGNNGNK
ncbi:MAG: hypothetical protein GOMPHAMPRED_001106 [Gomphillus americanus]|uniref:Uncharacterized protein n=1 Tax=Gomphillus americanus TaxID=1940652 RepID=A0A8H3IIG2_9LECA|nr:MAG: hypothetical protein GOMPHAMPRED_001106 [Gomphillus americanus]